MADLPMEVAEPLFPGSNFIKGAAGMPAVRQATMLVALAASVSLGLFATNWMQTPDYRPLGGAMSPRKTSEVIQALETGQLEYKLDQRSGLVLVPVDQIYSARMLLADAELIESDQLGYELLDKDPGFGVSQFMEVARHRRSVEGELAKSISTITAIQHARVLLATPKSTSFLRDRRKPSASVTVVLKPGRQLDSMQVRGITKLVASAVPELLSSDVVVVDQSGSLLSAGSDDPRMLSSERDLAFVRSIEHSLYDKIANILTPWVGNDRFTAEVSASIDFTRAEQTEEIYNPDLSAVRSEDLLEEQTRGNEASVGAVPGTLINNPPETAEVGQTNAGEQGEQSTNSNSTSKVRSTKNYEVDRTISHTRHQVGKLQRLSVSVVVDHRVVIDPESEESTSEPWSQEDISELLLAVRGAVGYQEERGDVVNVVNKPFFRESIAAPEPIPMWAEAWFSDLLKQLLGGIALIVVVFGLLRPLFKNLSQAGELVRERQSLAIADMTQVRQAALQEAVPGLPSPIAHQATDSNAHKMETVRNLIGEDPNRVAQVVKHWVNEDE